MDKEYNFTTAEIEAQISSLKEKGVTELSLHDQALSKDKKRILKILKKISLDYPELFSSILISPSVVDRELIAAAAESFTSLEIPLECSQKGGKLLFDKKMYASKARLLNEAGLVFGFQLSYALTPGDSLKLFMERLDFALQQYPNHIDFPQTEEALSEVSPAVTGTFSAKDIRYARDLAFAARTFYSAGRAVPWFLSVLKPLRIYPSRFFADFAEWQRCNNCDFKSGFSPEAENHKSIEKMQLLFLEQKYEEKKCSQLFSLVQDIVRLNGALSRLAGEGEESIVESSYHPDDIFGPESMDLQTFADNVCMEVCHVRIYLNGDNPDYSVE
ncbi:MAG: hypothetical protein K5681_02740 [Treponema sp.]|nr:hypothetical protein [Treponema sp.]